MELQLYEIRCIYCKRIHRSPYFDEVEERILACRDEAPEWQKGRLETWEDPNNRPITVESVALCGDLDSEALAERAYLTGLAGGP